MGERTEIAWTDATFNPWWGCTKVSPGCMNCYADTFARRVGHGKRLPTIWGPKAERKFFGDAHWRGPLKWDRDARAEGKRRRVFCASMADVFEDRPDLVDHRARLFRLIEATTALDWLLLTKRPENVQRLAAECSWFDTWPENVWIGTTAEDQERADERIPWLLEIPAAVRFVSVEPQIGPVDLESVHPYYLKRGTPSPHDPVIRIDALRGHVKGPDEMLDRRIDWVIVGGESGGGARPFDLAWARSTVRACRDAGVACFVKQAGANAHDSLRTMVCGWAPDDPEPDTRVRLKDKKGGDWTEWPADLRVREWPRGTEWPRRVA